MLKVFDAKEEVMNSKKDVKYCFPRKYKETTNKLYQPRITKTLNQVGINHNSAMLA